MIVVRSLAFVLAALNAANPRFQPKQEAARVVLELAGRHGFDPLTLIAVVDLESRWDPGAYNPRSGARGLGQHLAENSPACRSNPLGFECHAHVACLDDWRCNLKLTARAFAGWREYCRKRVGSALAVHWLQGYQGFDARRMTVCGHERRKGRWVALEIPKLTRRVMARRLELARIAEGKR